MIDADDINTEWWIVSEGLAASWSMTESPDRACDTCHGEREKRHRQSGVWCPDCVDGRHTFEIEAECSYENGTAPKGGHMCVGTVSLRVSVVPGMVLPIVEEGPDGITGRTDRIEADLLGQFWLGRSRIPLSSGARPGRYAIGIIILHKEET